MKINFPSSKRNRQYGANIAEFGPALLLFFIVICIPLINLIGYFLGLATAVFIIKQSANEAAVSETYNSALLAASGTTQNLTTSFLGKLVRLRPVGGFCDSGTNLYVVITNIATNKITIFGPNQPILFPVDTTNNVYEYEVRSNYQIDPLLNLGKVPFVGNIPIIGRPATFIFKTQQAAEYPNGLTKNLDLQSGNHPD